MSRGCVFWEHCTAPDIASAPAHAHAAARQPVHSVQHAPAQSKAGARPLLCLWCGTQEELIERISLLAAEENVKELGGSPAQPPSVSDMRLYGPTAGGVPPAAGVLVPPSAWPDRACRLADQWCTASWHVQCFHLLHMCQLVHTSHRARMAPCSRHRRAATRKPSAQGLRGGTVHELNQHTQPGGEADAAAAAVHG